MGSSFAAGAGIGPLKEGTPPRCGRTALNYASLLAAEFHLDLDDQSCGGATTAHLLGRWNELPAQVDAVTPATRLVTITVGGNDLGYMGLLFSASCDSAEQGCPASPAMPDRAAYGALQASLERLATAIREKAPQARIVFVQYVTLVPATGSCPSLPLGAAAREQARHLAAGLAQATRQAAEATGALVLPVDRLSANHTACDPQPWSRGFDAGYDGSQGAPWHPTVAGHAAIARQLEAMLRR